VKLFEIDDVCILFMRLDALDDLVLDIVHGLRIGRWPAFRTPFAAERNQAQLIGDAIDIEIEKNRGRRAIMVGGLT
jgi:hypothetical protein